MLKRIITFVILCLIFFFIREKAYAQIKTNLSLGSSFIEGSTINKFDIQTDLNISLADSTREFSTFFTAAYGELAHHSTNQEFSGGLKFDYRPQAMFTPFILLQAYNNVEKNIDLRMTALSGLKFSIFRKFIKDDKGKKMLKFDYSISVAVLYEAEKYISPNVPNREKMKLSIRPKIKHALGKNIYFEHITFYKVNLEDWQDYSFYSTTSLTSKITKKLQLKISYRIDYDNKLPKIDAVSKNDVTSNSYKVLMTSLVITL
jgi:hypothetical protein